MTLRLNWTAWLLAAALCAPIGCGDDDDDGHGDHDHTTDEEGKGTGKDGGSADSGSKPGAGDDELEVAGEWSGEFGDESISDDEWNGTPIVAFDNEDNVAYTQNADDAMFDPGKFNKLVWTEPTAEGFYYCTVDFGLDSLDDAKASKKTADTKMPEDMGSCGGFAFTKLEAK
jgi:hypothetical protein